MNKTIEFYYDFGSPTAYLAFTQLPAIADAGRAELRYRPVLLGGIFGATGNASPVSVAPKGRYMMDDLKRYARRYQVKFAMNPHFPINTLRLMRMACGLQARPDNEQARFRHAVFDAMWVQSLNLGDDAVVKRVLDDAGLDAERIQALALDEGVKQQLKQDTEAAVARGLFGVPTMFVGQDMFWGQDRLDFVEEALA